MGDEVLEAAGAGERVREIEDELRLAAGLTALREQAGLSQRELAERIGVSQPRIAVIERSHNVTIDVLERYVVALGRSVRCPSFRATVELTCSAIASRPQEPVPARKRTLGP